MKKKRSLSVDERKMLDKLELECYRRGLITSEKWSSLEKIKAANSKALDIANK